MPCEAEEQGQVILLAADAVNAGDAGDHDDIAAGEKGAHGGETQALDLLVDARILLDEGVGAGDVGLGLVIIKVTDEVLHGAFGKKLLNSA